MVCIAWVAVLTLRAYNLIRSQLEFIAVFLEKKRKKKRELYSLTAVAPRGREWSRSGALFDNLYSF